ncbi:MAG TPA: GlsB/YeaQ/YmgE family stress response membrane protein [Egicoccus sp.]|nr:GlsB/YeaQ/YmgE family stress response membrane protein [Egicoccus sp.]HSK24830.1 GlsB/YeaQ/YmgE family stress response membrane protein [Egicoccus sp.]
MGIIGFVVLGLLAGYLAHLVLPARRGMGAGGAALAGMGGSVVGGLVGSLIAGEGLQLGTAGLIGSVLGVLVAVLLAARAGRPSNSGVNRA